MTKIRFTIALLTITSLIYGCKSNTAKIDQPSVTKVTTQTVSVTNKIDVRAYQEYQSTRMTENRDNYNRRMAIVEETKLPYAVADTIVTLADKYDFYDQTIVGMINLESKYDIMATNVNSNGTIDKGLMQINSNTLPWLAKVSGNPDANPYNPHDNLNMGVWYLDYLRKQCDGSITCALARYNGDSTGVYQSVVRDRINKVASRMGISRERMSKNE